MPLTPCHKFTFSLLRQSEGEVGDRMNLASTGVSVADRVLVSLDCSAPLLALEDDHTIV